MLAWLRRWWLDRRARPIFTVVEATFQPRRLETLRPEATSMIGRRTHWRCSWLIEREDSGVFVGQHAWSVSDLTALVDWAGWVPTEDLADVVVVRW